MIKIITGRQPAPLHEKIIKLATEAFAKNSDRETFIIVPNHIKFTTEVESINSLARLRQKQETAVEKLHILSFSRLAWYFLQNEFELMNPVIDDAASTMLLAKIVKEKSDELILFKHLGKNSGLIKQIYTTILELRKSGVDLEEIDEDIDEETKNKVHDLAIIKSAYEAAILNHFMTKDDLELKLNEKLAEIDLSQKNFFFVDFSHFSIQEILTCKLLAKRAGNVTWAFATKNGQISPSQAGDYDYVVQKTISDLKTYFEKAGLKCEYELLPSPQTQKTYLNALWTEELPAESNDKVKDFIQLVKADSRYDEAYFVARTIYQQVALKKYRYRDFLVLAPNLHEYETYLGPILRQNQIPFFNDLQKEMKYHPLVILLENLADFAKTGIETTGLFAILKTKLLIPDFYSDESAFSYDIDLLENFALAHGINYSLWQRPLTSFVKNKVIRIDQKEEIIARLEKLRAYIINRLEKLFKVLKSETDSQKAITILFDFLVKNGVSKVLEAWRQKAIDNSDLQASQEPKQVWDTLLKLLKDYLQINPDNFDLDEFFTILTTGFKEANFAQIPSTLDAVNLSEMGIAQLANYKQVFIIGASSSNLPQISNQPGFLTSENLAQINSKSDGEHYLEDHQILSNLDQDYQFGNALALASDHIYVTYPVLNTSNEMIQPSHYYRRLLEFGANEFIQNDLPNADGNNLLSFITTPSASLGYLTFAQDLANQKELISLTKERIPNKAKQVLEGQNFDNNPISLGSQLAEKLYGSNLNSSVSQLETYYQNSLEYFLIYGLKLRKRYENELDVIQAGNYFHQTFDYLVKLLAQKQVDLGEINQSELKSYLKAVRKQMMDEGNYEQLLTDPFNRYLFTSLDRTTDKVAFNWQANLKKTPLKPKYSELSFGLTSPVKGLDFKLKDGKEINLRGKIDRVDLAKTEIGTIGQVIDYKSSSKSFDLALFANGISLQMVSYLDVLAKNAQFFTQGARLQLLGAFYQTITKNVERINSAKAIDKNFKLKTNLLDAKPKLMYNGLMVNDDILLKTAEPLLEDQNSSELYKSVKTKKDLSMSLPKNSAFTLDELQLVLKYNEYLIKKAGKEILSGQIALNPFKYENQTGLQYSDYQDIFFFDNKLINNQYKLIDSMNKKEFLDYIKSILEKEDNNG